MTEHSRQPERPVLGYATVPPSRRLRLVQHQDGISILFRESAVPALFSAVAASSAIGLEGCLLVVLAPVFLVASLLWALRAGVTWEALMFCAIGAGVIVMFVLGLRWRLEGAELSVRGGQISYRAPKSPADSAPPRGCAIEEVTEIVSADTRPIIRLRGGRELLGGHDAITVPGYAQLPTEAKRWVCRTLRDAVGLRGDEPA